MVEVFHVVGKLMREYVRHVFVDARESRVRPLLGTSVKFVSQLYLMHVWSPISALDCIRNFGLRNYFRGPTSNGSVERACCYATMTEDIACVNSKSPGTS
jgi:hypothetical protein